MCIITNQAALAKAGCTAGQETGYCATPPLPPPPAPLSCTHTDSRGDSYDLSAVPKVDGKWETIDKRPGERTTNPHHFVRCEAECALLSALRTLQRGTT